MEPKLESDPQPTSPHGSCQSGPKLLTSAFHRPGQGRSEFSPGTQPLHSLPHRYFELSSLSPFPGAVALTPKASLQVVAFLPLGPQPSCSQSHPR